MNRAELIEYVRLEIEQAEEDAKREDGTPWTWIDAAVSVIRDNLKALNLGPQEALSLLQMIDESKLSAMQFVASLPLFGDDANPQLLTREQASELLACSIQHIDRLVKDNQIKRVKVGQKVTRILRSSVVEFINQGGLH
ncbi:helix-turn-helix domain-containing protein [bacterium]|nr:helix-turn-helix domain-containing protein [bacterium]